MAVKSVKITNVTFKTFSQILPNIKYWGQQYGNQCIFQNFLSNIVKYQILEGNNVAIKNVKVKHNFQNFLSNIGVAIWP